MDFENFNQKIGGCGLYQWILFGLLSITTFKYAEDFQGLTLALYEPKFKCDLNFSQTLNSSSIIISDDQCKYKMHFNDSKWKQCSKWIYERDVMHSTFVSEFDMVCQNAYTKNLMFTFYFSGGLVSYIFVILSDTVGRRFILMISLFSSVILTVCQVLSYSLSLQYALAFISNAIKTIYIGLSFTTLVEIMPINKLDIAASNFWILYGVGYMCTALFGYCGGSWRIIYLSSLSLSIFYLLYPFFVFETPRWLMLNQRRVESYKVLTFIGKINRHSITKEVFDQWNPIKQTTGRFWNLFKYKIMVYRLLILNFAAWSFSFAYIGSATDLTFASKNIFLTTLVMGVIEFPTGPLASILANRLGRKQAITILCGLGIFCLIIMPFLESEVTKSIWQPWLKMVLAMGAKLGFTSSWIVFDILTNEIVPTSDRNSAVSIVYIAVGLGSIVAPSIHNAANNFHYAAPCLIYSAILCITVFLVRMFLPETHHLPIPQTIKQATSLIKGKENIWKQAMIEEAARNKTIISIESETQMNNKNTEEID